MASAFEAVLPLIEDFKNELAKLTKATAEIRKVELSATESSKAAVTIASQVEKLGNTHTDLKNTLEAQHLAALNHQLALLQTHLDDFTARSTAALTPQFADLKQAGQTAQLLTDKLLADQPLLLAAIAQQHTASLEAQRKDLRQTASEELASLKVAGEEVQKSAQKLLADQPLLLAAIAQQHTNSLTEQKTELQKAAQAAGDLFQQKLQAELNLLRQATDTLQVVTRKQHDDLSAINDQLQVATGRIKAFADTLNAAKFLTSLDKLAADLLQAKQAQEQARKATAATLERLDSQAKEHEKQRRSDLKVAQEQAEAITRRLNVSAEKQEQQQTVLLAALETAATQTQALLRQVRLYQLVALTAILAGATLLYFKY